MGTLEFDVNSSLQRTSIEGMRLLGPTVPRVSGACISSLDRSIVSELSLQV